MDNINLKGSTFFDTPCTGCVKKVDPFKFKLSVVYCIILNAPYSKNIRVKFNPNRVKS